ncbi:hypothetical protein [Mesorhizobium sp. 8]|uniref:hypothetical protein n=1 Tax=Mesorhizobium sp. 8 TaxID=2584466 RepID=UPI0011240726|nr:hypothetical protein [Mesorhizobium sp. 8]QDC00371.1 hypothetical protein FGU64_08045 [Mesorhizobium sp. 8]
MLRILVTTTIVSQRDTQRLVHFAMEVDEPSLEKVHEALVRDGSIFGQRIVTEFKTEGVRRIIGRVPQIVGLATLATATICTYEFVEPEGGSDE